MPETKTSKELLVIDGKKTAATIRQEIKTQVLTMKKKFGVTPGLATVLVGNRTDSATYVRFKKRAALEVGFHSIDRHLDEKVTEEEVLEVIASLASDDSVHAILVQLPLPSHISEPKVLKAIPVSKDVDGFSAENIGHLVMRGVSPPLAMPCTPWGCIELLLRYQIPMSGKHAVVLGRSNIVGMPIAAMLQQHNATVTVCHSKTKNLEQHLREADIIIAAIGRTEFVKGSMVKSGAVVIDVGINSVADPSRKRGYRLVGDVDYSQVSKKASAITPVPGGVGPMTIAMLLKNTVNLAMHGSGIDSKAVLSESAEEPPPLIKDAA